MTTKERPILFSAPMVRAILDGTKSQTRRVAPIDRLDIKPAGNDMVTWGVHFTKPVKRVLASHSGGAFTDFQARSIIASQFCPYGQPGDRLWVRETWQYHGWTEDGEPIIGYAAGGTRMPLAAPDLIDVWAALSEPSNYAKHGRACDQRWRQSIHMPRWASRITLEITGVRVERLQDILEEDAKAEGLSFVADGCARFGVEGLASSWCDCPVTAYAALWESINGPGSWDANPWVWAISFKRIK